MRESLLRNLYCGRRLSMMQMAEALGTTHATVLYWLKKYGIQRRSWSESTYVKRNPNGDPFSIPFKLTRRQQDLMVGGLLLYWAEGNKRGSSLAIGNLDPRMLRLFLAFLREVCFVDERRISLFVRVHKQFSCSAARRFWSCQLGLPLARVFMYPHTDTRSKADEQWSPYGIATLQFSNTKLKAWLSTRIERYIERQLQGGPRRYPERWLLRESDASQPYYAHNAILN